jgi:hypothetical protein
MAGLFVDFIEEKENCGHEGSCPYGEPGAVSG